MRFKSEETNERLFMHYPFAWSLWKRLFGMFEEQRISPPNLLTYVQRNYSGLECKKEKKALWTSAMHSIFWCVWAKHNSRIFYDLYLHQELVWDKVVHLTSHWVFANRVVPRIPLPFSKRDWRAVLY